MTIDKSRLYLGTTCHYVEVTTQRFNSKGNSGELEKNISVNGRRKKNRVGKKALKQSGVFSGIGLQVIWIFNISVYMRRKKKVKKKDTELMLILQWKV